MLKSFQQNQIMEHILVPGDVYVRPGKRTLYAQRTQQSPFSRFKRFLGAMTHLSLHSSGQPHPFIISTTDVSLEGQFTLQQRGFQLLATCKQAYNEGRYMFYTMNTFHWPPGPVNITDGWNVNLQPEHQKMIKNVCIDLNLVSLTYGDMEAVEASARRGHGGQPGNHDGNFWSYEAVYQLERRVWSKILSLYCCDVPGNLRGFVGLERMIFQSSIGRCVLNSQLKNDETEWESLVDFITAVSNHLRSIIRFHVNGRGWRKTKTWLEGLSTIGSSY